jgi:hypothetical protein
MTMPTTDNRPTPRIRPRPSSPQLAGLNTSRTVLASVSVVRELVRAHRQMSMCRRRWREAACRVNRSFLVPLLELTHWLLGSSAGPSAFTAGGVRGEGQAPPRVSGGSAAVAGKVAGAPGISADGERLVSIATAPGQRSAYRYDFGDNWWGDHKRSPGWGSPSPIRDLGRSWWQSAAREAVGK